MTAQAMTPGQYSFLGRPITGAAVTRFAPSPTGPLHLGHAYSAMMSHDLAKNTGGAFLLRIEDIDGSRSRPEYIDAIIADLRWLNLCPDRTVVIQSQRTALYRAALDRLHGRGLIYRCVCTRAEIAESASAPQGDQPTVYPGTCRATVIADDDPRPSCWRLDMARAIAATGANGDALVWGDVVIARKDTLASYHLAVTIDDAAQGVTDVVRGNDLLAATPIHRLLQMLLALPTPRYHHHPLIAGPDGLRLAKRASGTTLADMRSADVDPVVLMTALRAGRFPIGFALLDA